MKTQNAIFVLFIGVFAGCREPVNPEDLPNIDGTWTMTETINWGGRSCRFVGTMDIRQDGEDMVGRFTRAGQCSIGDLQGTTAAAQTGTTTTGRVGMETVDFRIGDCDYRGVIVTPDEPDQITGTILCTTILLTGGISTAAGTWTAARITGE